MSYSHTKHKKGKTNLFFILSDH